MFYLISCNLTSPSLAIEETHRKLIASQYPMINLALHLPLFPRLLIDMFFIPINSGTIPHICITIFLNYLIIILHITKNTCILPCPAHNY